MEFTPSWGVEKVWGEYSFYNTGSPAADKYAFVIDSGISLDTGDLNVNTQWAKSFTGDDAPFDDGLGHGTAVASVIGAIADEYGLTGVAPGAQVVPLKVFGNNGYTTNRRVQDACLYAMEIIFANDLIDDAVVNLSLGSFQPDAHAAVELLNAAGITVVVSAGNSKLDVDRVSPASYGHLPNVYTVSSTTIDNTYSHFTNYDNGQDEDDVDYAAPGSRIPTYSTSGGLRTLNGTSFSAPHVAGLLLMGGIKEGPTYQLSDAQAERGMVPDPLALLDYDPCPEPDPIYIEVPIDPPQTTFVGDLDAKNNIQGSVYDDVIIGGRLNDKLKGGSGNDYIVSFGGKDVVKGGHGADTFVLSTDDGFTVIKDFEAGIDTLVLPSDNYELAYKRHTNVYINDDLVARINGIHNTIV